MSRFLPQLKSSADLKSALDAGCGIGFFSILLRECGLDVQAFDGRESNINEARQRYPEISFRQGDIEDSGITHLGSFDLVLCFGLLYHLENPLRAIRHLHSLTGKVLLLESMCLPTYELQVLLREEPDSVDQSLTDLAFYPSEGSIVKMLFRAGFRYVYRIADLPDHDEFRDTPSFTRRRTIVLASREPILLSGLIPLDEPHETGYPWQKPVPQPSLPRRLMRFWQTPAKDKRISLARRLHSRFPRAALPIRLPFGMWWLARNDHISKPIIEGEFENSEYNLVRRFLQSGMTVLDIGAHHGFYSLLSSSIVGPSGRVFSFEPSPRERKALLRHVRINSCSNIFVQPFAVGAENKQADLHLVDASVSGCNSLRQPAILSDASSVSVQVVRLDDWVASQRLSCVDFMKLDVEGAELEVLKGAPSLLTTAKRPVILVEVYDIRTQPWGYRAREIVGFLNLLGYRWFRLLGDGKPQPIDPNLEVYDANLVAIPAERAEENSGWA